MPKATQRPTPKVGPPHRRSEGKPATAQQLASLTFQAWPEALAAVGTGESWAKDMREKAFPLVLGLHTLSFDDVALTNRLKTGDADSADTALTLAEWLGTQATAFRALAGFCETAETRLMCALSRIALEHESAARAQS